MPYSKRCANFLLFVFMNQIKDLAVVYLLFNVLLKIFATRIALQFALI